MAFVDLNDSQARQRIERKRFLERRVVETLALKPPKPGPLLKEGEHGTYKLSPDEEQQAVSEYRRRSRQARILQVRAQEMLLAAERVGEFRERKKREKQKLLQVLKEAWKEEQGRRIADLEGDFVHFYKGIGQSHDAAQTVSQKLAEVAEKKAKEAEESRIWEKMRFQKAMQEEIARKSEAGHEQSFAKERRKVVNHVAALDRRRARCFHAFHARSEIKQEKKHTASEEDPGSFLHIDFNSQDIRRNFIQSRMPGAPSDYKDTYFHSRFSIFKDQSNLGQCPEDSDRHHHEAEVDAWEAAEVRMKTVELEKERKAEIDEVWNKRRTQRGQTAVAHLQKTAMLEAELAVELEEEKERKRLLDLIEELSTTVHPPTYKPDVMGSLQTKWLRPNEEFEGANAAAVEICGDDAMVGANPDTISTGEAGVLDVGSTPPAQLGDVSEQAQIVEQPEMSVGDAEAHRESAQQNESKDESNDESNLIVSGMHDDQVVSTKVATSRKRSTMEDMKSSSHASRVNITGLSLNRLHGRLKDEVTGYSINPIKPPGCTPRGQNACGSTKTLKDGRSGSQVPSLPNFSRNKSIRKGNKSPQKVESVCKQTSKWPDSQETGEQSNELRKVPKVLGKDQAKESAENLETSLDKRSGLPACFPQYESCTPVARRKSPRRPNGTWLSNIFDKLTWWKSDATKKDLPSSLVAIIGEQAEGVGSSSGGKSCRVAATDVGKETISRLDPLNQTDGSKCEVQQLIRKKTPITLESVGEFETLKEPQQRNDEQTERSEVYTTKIFGMEELEALRLELYGPRTGTPSHKKVRSDKEKSMPVSSKQRDNSVVCVEQCNDPVPKCNDSVPKAHSIDGRRNPSAIAQSKEKELPQCGAQRARKDSTTQYTCGMFETECFPDTKSAKGTAEITEVKGDVCSRGADSEPVEVQKNNDVLVESSGRGQLLEFPGKPPPNSQKHCVSSTFNSVATVGNESGAPTEPMSAREVAEKLIRAWRAGQLGGNVDTTLERARQKLTPMSRKRRARTDEEPHFSASLTGTTLKLEHLRGKINNRPSQTNTTKLRKSRAFASSQSAVLQEKKQPNTKSLSEGKEIAKNSKTPSEKLQIPSKLTTQHSQSTRETKASENSCVPDMNLKVEDIVPEARSLDFILGSLSAQVRELDERLRNVTFSCSRETTDSLVTDASNLCEEHKSSSDPTEAMSNTKLASTLGVIGNKTRPELQSSGSGEPERLKTTPSLTPIAEESVHKGNAHKAVPLNSPKTSKYKSSRVDGKCPSPQKCQERTFLSASRSTAIRDGRSPTSSLGVCLEDMADLVKEMNGLPACEKIRAQLAQDSLLVSLPKWTETDAIQASKQDGNFSETALSTATKTTKKCLLSPVMIQYGRDEAVDLSRSYAEMCSQNAGPTILRKSATLDTERLVHDGKNPGIVNSSTDLRSRSSLWQPERASLSSINLAEAMSLEANEDQTLLSTSMDFSPWKTENLPDFFSSLASLGRGLNSTKEREPSPGNSDGDCSPGIRPLYCHMKEGSKYVLKGSKLKRKSKAFEKKRVGRVKGKQKKSSQKLFSSIALPPKLPVADSPKLSTLRARNLSPLKFRSKEFMLAKTPPTNSNLSTRSLPAELPLSVSIKEVQKWLCRDTAGCPTSAPHDSLSGRSTLPVAPWTQLPGPRRPEGMKTASKWDSSTSQQGKSRSSQLSMRRADGAERQPMDQGKRPLELKQRPASAGTIPRDLL